VLIYSFGVSVDGYISDRAGGFGWSPPTDELFAFHLERVRGLSSTLLGRRLYEAMTVWETDPALRATPAHAAFADVWTALPKVVFSRTLTAVEGHARLSRGAVGDEIASATAGGGVVEIGGADLAGQAFELGMLDELRIFRHPVVVGGGTRHLPPVDRTVSLELLDERRVGGGVVYERYGVTR
jgi:dihydrofolate reductase